MEKKVLFVSHTANFSKFNRPFMRWFKENGYGVDYTSMGEEAVFDCDNHYEVPFSRFPFSFGNIKAYIQLKKRINDGDYCLVHCHTPVGGVVARLASRDARKNGLKVVYTAHGFHFYKGAPLINWILYYPIEKILSRYTDALVTINTEDYNNAISHKFKAKNIYKINGVGVDLSRFKAVNLEEKSQLRRKYGYSDKEYILIKVAELNVNKSQNFLINQIVELKKDIPNIKLLLVGTGEYEDKYKELVEKLKIKENVDFLGYRKDVENLYVISDICTSASAREGLPINIIEAMACGLSIVCSVNRGHVELIEDKENGFLYNWCDAGGFRNCIKQLYNDHKMSRNIGEKNSRIVEKYSQQNAISEMSNIYIKLLS